MQKLSTIVAAAAAGTLLFGTAGAVAAQSYAVRQEAVQILDANSGVVLWSEWIANAQPSKVYGQASGVGSTFLNLGSLQSALVATNVATYGAGPNDLTHLLADGFFSGAPITLNGPSAAQARITITAAAAASAFGSGQSFARLYVDGAAVQQVSATGVPNAGMVVSAQTLTYTTVISGGQSLSFAAQAWSAANPFNLPVAQRGQGFASASIAPTVTIEMLSNIQPVPEPSTWAMMTAGFGALGFALRRRRLATA